MKSISFRSGLVMTTEFCGSSAYSNKGIMDLARSANKYVLKLNSIIEEKEIEIESLKNEKKRKIYYEEEIYILYKTIKNFEDVNKTVKKQKKLN